MVSLDHNKHGWQNHSLFPLTRHLRLNLRFFRKLSISLPSISSLIKVLLLHRVEDRAKFSYEKTLSAACSAVSPASVTYPTNMDRWLSLASYTLSRSKSAHDTRYEMAYLKSMIYQPIIVSWMLMLMKTYILGHKERWLDEGGLGDQNGC